MQLASKGSCIQPISHTFWDLVNGWVEEYTYDTEGILLKTADIDPFHNNKKSTKYACAYDSRGNLIKKEEICSPTTQGPKNITIATYT